MRHVGVRHFASVQIGVFLELKFINVPAVRIWNRVPAPVRQRAERRRVFKRFGKSLQSRRVHGETKLSIADGQRIIRVEIRQHHVVPRDERVAVNRRGQNRRRDGQREGARIQAKQAFHLERLLYYLQVRREQNLIITWVNFFWDSIPARKA